MVKPTLKRTSNSFFHLVFLLLCGCLLLILTGSLLLYMWANFLTKDEFTSLQKLVREPSSKWVTFADIPEPIREGTILIEDRDFYKNEYLRLGPLTAIRVYLAIFVLNKPENLTISPLSSQVIKLQNFYQRANSPVKEFILALQIQTKLSRNEILELYLNTAPYGQEASGIQAATKQYFDKDVSALTLVESAFLVGLPQRPSTYSPYGGRLDEQGIPLWETRTKLVLLRMKENGYISETEYNQALDQVQLLQFRDLPSYEMSKN